MPTAARVQRVLAKDHTNYIGHIRGTDGSLTKTTSESLELLLSTHFSVSSTYTAETFLDSKHLHDALIRD